MCMEDIKLGRELAPRAFVTPIANGAWVQVLDGDPSRTRIIFSGDAQNTFQLFPEQAPGALQIGFAVNSNFIRLVVTVEEWGRLVTAPWFCFTTALAANLAVMVSTLERQK